MKLETIIKEKLGDSIYEEEYNAFRLYIVTKYIFKWIEKSYLVKDKEEFYEGYFNLSLKIDNTEPIKKNTFFFILNVLTATQGYILKESRRLNKKKVLTLKPLEIIKKNKIIEDILSEPEKLAS